MDTTTTDSEKPNLVKESWPSEIVIKSDGNELLYIGLVPRRPKDKIQMAYYKFVKSETNLNKIIPLSLEQVNKLINSAVNI